MEIFVLVSQVCLRSRQLRSWSQNDAATSILRGLPCWATATAMATTTALVHRTFAFMVIRSLSTIVIRLAYISNTLVDRSFTLAVMRSPRMASLLWRPILLIPPSCRRLSPSLTFIVLTEKALRLLASFTLRYTMIDDKTLIAFGWLDLPLYSIEPFQVNSQSPDFAPLCRGKASVQTPSSIWLLCLSFQKSRSLYLGESGQIRHLYNRHRQPSCRNFLNVSVW